jgi:hypothetical protein
MQQQTVGAAVDRIFGKGGDTERKRECSRLWKEYHEGRLSFKDLRVACYKMISDDIMGQSYGAELVTAKEAVREINKDLKTAKGQEKQILKESLAEKAKEYNKIWLRQRDLVYWRGETKRILGEGGTVV